jgi:hypothetical protein
MINSFGDMPNDHDMLTGSDSDGRALSGIDASCNNWTSDGTDHKAMLGHSKSNGPGAVNTSWNSSHMSRDCTKQGLIAARDISTVLRSIEELPGAGRLVQLSLPTPSQRGALAHPTLWRRRIG